MADQLSRGARFRALTVVDVFTREALAIEVGQQLRAADVVAALERLRRQRGCPETLAVTTARSSPVSSSISGPITTGCASTTAGPGSPPTMRIVESFNGTFRDECLNAHWFESIADARAVVESWRVEYNESRPHRALGEVPPAEFARRFRAHPEPTVNQMPRTHIGTGTENGDRSKTDFTKFLVARLSGGGSNPWMFQDFNRLDKRTIVRYWYVIEPKCVGAPEHPLQPLVRARYQQLEIPVR